MQSMNEKGLSDWKQCVQDAMLELDPHTFRNKLKIARTAIEARRFELNSTGNPDPREREELSDSLRSINTLEYLDCKKRS